MQDVGFRNWGFGARTNHKVCENLTCESYRVIRHASARLTPSTVSASSNDISRKSRAVHSSARIRARSF